MRRNVLPFLALAAAIVGGVAYPLLVYFTLPYLPPAALIAVALALVAVRMLGARLQAMPRAWTVALAMVAIGLLALAAVSPQGAVKAYPVLVSLAAASVFGASLISSPTLVERIARITEPDLPPEGVVYTRAVTKVWTAFLVGNAAVATAVGIWGSAEQWTLWNGLISYLLMGALFAGEWTFRRFVLRRA
jgi:uncharacterized membrane protein